MILTNKNAEVKVFLISLRLIIDWDNFGKKPLNETSVGKLEEKLVNTFF